MASLDPGLVEQFLNAGTAALAGMDAPARQGFLAEAKARLMGRSPEDRREASKITVEIVKLFITISVGVFAGIVALVQFTRSNGVQWTSPVMGVFAFTAVILVGSMIAGFYAISRISQRADGRLNPEEAAWSTEAVKGYLRWQARLGLASLVLVAVALVIWSVTGAGVTGATPAVAITIPGSPGGTTTAGGALTIEGVWTSLKVKVSSGHELTLPPQGQPVSFACR